MPTAKPKILSEVRPEVALREPPAPSTLRPHPWLAHEQLSEFRSSAKSGDPFDVYISSSAEREVRNHAQEEAAKNLEVLGFLLGEVFSWRGRKYTVVRGTGTTELKSTSSKVRFDPVAYPRLFHSLDDSGYEYIIVGWYHSHPGHTCFMSKVDLETQRTIFNEPYHVALVIDPLNRDIRTYRLQGEDCVETRFAVYQDNRPGGSSTKKARRRRLKIEAAADLESSQ
jgi:proteasome lid subunit RPN8/RPN11